MKTSMTGAALVASLATAAVAEGVRSAQFSIEVINKATDASIGHLWMERKEAHFPDPVYGDAAYDLMFIKQRANDMTFYLDDLYNPKGSDAWMACSRGRPGPCTGAILNVGGGEWEAGHYLVDGKFRYEMEPELGWSINNYSKETGIADFEYSNGDHEYVFYGRLSFHDPENNSMTNHVTACGEVPAGEGDEPSGDLVIKYADEPTPSECQDVRLQLTLMKDLENFEPVQLCEFTGCSTK